MPRTNSPKEDAFNPATLFVDPEFGFPIGFFIHKSIKNHFKIANLTRDIENHGGTVLESHTGADTVLVDTMYEQRDILQRSYDVDPNPGLRNIHVESETFVSNCIKHQIFQHRNRERKGMGGRLGYRVEFTAEDDERLCQYLATTVPNKGSGGRRGNEIYKNLVEFPEVRPNDYEWVNRHTWESWRNRYNKNVLRFDRRIEEIATLVNPTDKQLYHRDRRLGKVGRGRIGYRRQKLQKRDLEEDEEGEGERSEEEVEEVKNLVNQERRTIDPQQKRRRQGDRRYSLPAAPPSKRQRTTRHSEPNPANDDDEMDNRGLSSEEHTPSPTLVNTLKSEPQKNSTTALQLPTKATPVAAPPVASGSRIPASRSDGPNLTNSSNSKAKKVIELSDDEEAKPISAQKQPPRSRRSRNLDLTLVPTRVLRGASNAAVPRVAFTHATGNNNVSASRAMQPSAPPARRVAARKVATRPSPRLSPPATETAPYRNTRSRSRSVEPSTMALPTRKRKKKAVQRDEEEREEVPLEPVVEGDLEGEAVNAEAITISRTTETFEEMDVADLLIADLNDFSAVSNPDAQSSHSRHDSLTTDDAQTDDVLRGVPRSNYPAVLDIHPDDILRQFGTSQPRRSRSSLPLSTQAPLVYRASALRQEALKPRRSEPFPLRRSGRPNPFSTPQRGVPKSLSQSNRQRSSSSSESFPMSGTRASAVKKILEQHEKHTRFEPVQGTRAALLSPSS